jgi:hypothetical protein
MPDRDRKRTQGDRSRSGYTHMKGKRYKHRLSTSARDYAWESHSEDKARKR